MKTSRQALGGTLIGLAVAAAMAPAYGQEDEAAALKRPDSAISLGAGIASGDARGRSIWGQYNGMRDHRASILLDFDYVNRNDATGFWTTARGRNLGLQTRELGFGLQKQGDWRFSGEYSEIVHEEIRTINTGMLNAGSTTPTVQLITPGTGGNLNLELRRKALGLSADKWISTGFQFEAAFRNEDKTGARMWGRGYACRAASTCNATQSAANQTWALLMIPEPVNFNTKQIDAKLNYSRDGLFLSAGYYGSFFTNANGNVAATVPNQLYGPTGLVATLSPAASGPSLQNVLASPMALYPDNQAHQFYLTGNYAWTPKTRSTFKVAYTHATQNEDFNSMGFTGLPTVTRTSLGGVLDTTLVQFGITSRPIDKLTLLGNVRYEKKQDRTPIERYNIEDTTRWDNAHITNRKLGGKFEASYMLPANVRGTLGFDYDKIERELPDPVNVDIGGISGLRGETEERTFRGELRRSISETLTGAVGYSHSKRTGSDWYSLVAATYGQILSPGAIFNRTNTYPYNLTDRTRDKVKASADWTPNERLSLQFVGEVGSDSYDPPSENGLRKGDMNLFSLDAAYALSDAWKLIGYGSVGNQNSKEADRTNYVAETKNRTTALGAGIAGKPMSALQVGANFAYVRDVTKYALSPDVATTAANVAQNAVGLPDVTFTETRFGIFGIYALDKQSDVRVDLMQIRNRLQEWSYGYNGVPFVFQDGTTVTINPYQRVTFLSARYTYRF